MKFRARHDAFDRFQRRHSWLGFPLAVGQKYSEDQGGYLAATITFYGFVSMFPLLLVATTVLGFVLRGHPHLQTSILDSALGQFPVIGHELQLHRLRGSLAPAREQRVRRLRHRDRALSPSSTFPLA